MSKISSGNTSHLRAEGIVLIVGENDTTSKSHAPGASPLMSWAMRPFTCLRGSWTAE